MKTRINLDELHAQLCNALEAEQGAIRIYETAHRHAASPALQQRCARSLDEARRNQAALLSILSELGFDAQAQNGGRRAVRQVGDALATAMQRPGVRRQQIVAECVRLADRRERANWELFGQLLAPRRSDAKTSAAPHAHGTHGHHWLQTAARARVDRPAAARRAVAA